MWASHCFRAAVKGQQRALRVRAAVKGKQRALRLRAAGNGQQRALRVNRRCYKGATESTGS